MQKNINSDTIRLGLMSPLTGLVSLYGKEISWAGRIACDEVNEQGGVLGKNIELVIADDGSMPKTAVPAAEYLIDDKNCVAIIGNLLSNSRIAIAYQVAEVKKIPYLNFSFYEGSIYSDYFFHFAALPNQQIDKMIPYMQEHFGPKMFFAGSNYEWPRGSIDAAIRSLIVCGGEIVGEEYIPFGELNLYIDDLLNKLSTSGANVFVPYFAGSDQQSLLMEFTKRGLKDKVTVVMGHYDEAMAATLPAEVREGFYSSNTYFMTLKTPKNKDYLNRLAELEEVTGITPDGNGVLTNFGEGTYLCVKAFAQAVNKAGSVNVEDVIRALENVRVMGPQGEVIMDPHSHHVHVNSYISRCNREGVFEIVQSFGLIDPIIPKIYQDKFNLEVDFKNERIQTKNNNVKMHSEKHYRPHTGNPEEPHTFDNSLLMNQPTSLPHVEQFRFATAVCIMDQEGMITQVNKTFLKLWGTLESLKGFNGKNLWESPEKCDVIFESLTESGEWTGTLNARTQSGIIPDVQVTFEAIQYTEEEQIGYKFVCLLPKAILIKANIVEEYVTTQQVLSMADVVIIATDEDANIIRVNQRACEVFGYTKEELVGHSIHLLLPPKFRERHKHYFNHFLNNMLEIEIQMGDRGSIFGYRKDGSEFPAEATISKFSTNKGLVGVVTLHDISEHKKHEDDLMWKATHDPLTNLPNRALIRERITHALERTRRTNQSIAILFIDLDGFKLVNDTLGHDAGDKLLTTVGERLIDSIRPGDTAARFGGDEFIILCESVGDNVMIFSLAERICKSIKKPINIGGQEVVITSSIGIAFGHGDTHSENDLLRMADTAMYSAKELGNDRWKIFNDSIHATAKLNLEITNGLYNAIAQDELGIRLQPIVDGKNGKIIGAEVLIRWFSKKGEISPAVFIPISELTGTIGEIGEWVFEKACLALIKACSKKNCTQDFYISVNVSTKQLNDSRLPEKFVNILKKTGADPARIVLEITETSLMTDVESNLGILHELYELGFKVAVDDFGTGYSSLAQLLRMPVNKLKIDQIFINGMESQKELNTIVEAVINMAHILGYKTIAEGAENKKQVDMLRKMNCDYIQGYFFYKPMPLEEFLEALEKQ